jgi:hypothetical protein
MKRGIAFVLALIMILSIIAPVFAEGNYDKELEKAIVKSKELFDIGSEYDKFTSSIGYQDEKVVFYLNWSDSKNKIGNINVSVTRDGTVLNYGKWKPVYEEQSPKLPKISKKEGLKIAEEFINKVAPEFKNSIKYIDRGEPMNLGSEVYTYFFIRTENGIPYYENNIEMYVNKYTGEIRDYYSNWDLNLKFPDAKDIIDKNKAKELYKEKVGLDLIYKSIYKKDKQNYFLVYSPLDENLGIDAKDGDVKHYFNIGGRFMEMGAGGIEDAKNEDLSPDEIKAIDTMKDLISKEEAEKVAREYLNLDEKYKLEAINLYSSYSGEGHNWQLYFSTGKDDDIEYANISIDAKTKELQSFYIGGKESQGEIKYNKEECQKIAEEFIKKHNSKKYPLMELEKSYVETDENKKDKYNPFNFIRKIDDAYVISDGVRIAVDGISGKVTEYSINWEKGEFPSMDNIISKEKALEILFKDIDMELKYIYPDRYNNNIDRNREAQLVYGLKTDKPANIDGNTGQILNYSGEPYKKYEVINYKDIDNSYAKDKINILAEFGIALPGDEFRPQEKINQRDFLYLLVKAKEPYYYSSIEDSDDNLYNSAIRLGIIKEGERAADKVITREIGIKYIINALGYGKVAELPDIYVDIFKDKDIDKNLEGHIAIAYGLKIINGNDGYFKPKAELKREDAINMIYNMLFN